MRKTPQPKTVDMKKLMALTIPNRLVAARSLYNSPEGVSFLESLTPTQLAALFPDYYKRALPDLGKATSGGTSMGGGTRTGRSYATGGSPGPGGGNTTPATPSGTPPSPSIQSNIPSTGGKKNDILSSTKEGRASSRVWENGTTVVNKEGKLLDKIKGGNLVPDSRGYVDPKAYYSEALMKLESSKLIGFVPKDGERFGIKTGSKEEWARFMTQLTKQESGFNVNTIGDGGRSKGLSQMLEGEYGIKNPHDPHQAQSGMIKQFEKYVIASEHIAGTGSGPGTYGGYRGVAAYFGPLRREKEFFQHNTWMEKLRPTIDNIGEELPTLGMFTKEALTQKEKTAAPTEQNQSGDTGLTRSAVPATESGIIPVNKAGFGIGMNRGERTYTEDQIKARSAYQGGKLSFEGFTQKELQELQAFDAGSGGSDAYPSVPPGTYSLSPQATGSTIRQSYQRSPLAEQRNLQGAFGKVYNVHTSGIDAKVGRSRTEIQIHSNVRSDINKLVSHGCLTVTPQEYTRLIKSIDAAMSETGGKVSLVVGMDEKGKATYKIMPSSIATNSSISVNEAVARQQSTGNIATPVESKEKPIEPSKENTNIASKVWTSLERAPTKEEIKASMDKGVKYFDYDLSKTGAKEAQKMIKELGGESIAYHRGPGNKEWGESYQSKESVLKQIKGMDSKYIHLDNQEQWSYADFKSVVDDARSSGKVIQPKNAIGHWNRYLKENPTYNKDILYGVTENQAAATQTGPLKSLNAQVPMVNMEWQQGKSATNRPAAENLLKETGVPSIRMQGPEVPEANKGGYHSPGADVVAPTPAPEPAKEQAVPVKEPEAPVQDYPEYRHGGTQRVPEAVSLHDNRTGKKLATMGDNETIKIDDGKMQVTPERRLHSRELESKFEKVSDAREKAADKNVNENSVINRVAAKSGPVRDRNADWKSMMDTVAHSSGNIFQSVAFQRAVGKSRFVEVGDPITGGHYQDFATDMKLA